MLTEFNHVTVPSRDLETSIAFYTSLGMQLIELEKKHHAHFENKEHHVIFTVYYNEKKPDYEVTVYFEVEDIEQYVIRFRKKSPVFNPFQSWGGSTLQLKDPDRNTIILYTLHIDGAIPPWKEN